MANILTSVGKSIITNLLSGLGGTVPKYIGWGTGAGTAAIGDTDLFTPASEARVAATVSRTTTTVANDTLQLVGTLTVSGSGKTITNVGAFDASTSGNLFIHADHSSFTLNVGEAIQYTLTVQFS
jgi:hypothetical protein